MTLSISVEGIRTARPKRTYASRRCESQARIVHTLRLSASAACVTVSGGLPVANFPLL
jgi:hypothetical protein